jgi:amidase
MTQASDIFSSAVDLLEQISRGEKSAAELLEAHVVRYRQVNPAINAVVREDLEAARLRAQALDRMQAAGERAGPLHGLPITIKDTFDVEGMPATAGAPEYAKRPAKTPDAAAVAKLRAAGAVIWGKTNTPYLAGDNQTSNPVHGRTSNPWDINRTPGGSSGGAAGSRR